MSARGTTWLFSDKDFMWRTYEGAVLEVVDTACREGWALKLLKAARTENPNGPVLQAFLQSVGLNGEE